MAEAQEDEDLRYWLGNEDWYMSQYTRQWLERTPPEIIGDVLAHIAEDAQPEPREFWSVLATFFANTGLATSSGIAGGGPKARKAGTRAALLLAERNDPRSIPPLVRVFSTGGILQNKYQEGIETALTRFLTLAANQPDLDIPIPDVEILAKRIWQYGGGRRDLTPSFTELLLAALRFLQAQGEESSTPFLRAIAEANTREPNRQRVKNAAGALLTR